MKNILKSWKTTLVGLIALAGLSYNAYLNGGFSVQDFLTLIIGVGFLISKDGDQTHSNTSEDKGDGAITPTKGF